MSSETPETKKIECNLVENSIGIIDMIFDKQDKKLRKKKTFLILNFYIFSKRELHIIIKYTNPPRIILYANFSFLPLPL
jgi:hypothetical protein